MIITTLKGNSNSFLSLEKTNDKIFVRKTGDIDRNIERYTKLDLPFPKIYKIESNYYEMEYIKHIDIATYLKYNSPLGLIKFLDSVIKYLKNNIVYKNYIDTYELKLKNIEFEDLIFNKKQLIDKLPRLLPSSLYFGDLTLENILWDYDNSRFVLIDGLTSEYDSYIFDLHKLKQDIVCGWFIRNNNVKIEDKLRSIDNYFKNYPFYDNKYLTILMLLRILPYTKTTEDYLFLIRKINKLWI